jgi:hypothetical protein
MNQGTRNTNPRNHIWTVFVCETSDSGTTGSSVPIHFPLPGTKTTNKRKLICATDIFAIVSTHRIVVHALN